MNEPSVLSSRGERTRDAILDAALELFRRHGYEQTTMRMIATAAGASLGNSYYYFPTKEHLVQAFYLRMQADLIELCRERLQRVTPLRARVLTVLGARLELIDPYHDIAGTLFASAASPVSPLSPFSAESEPARRSSIELWRDVVAGSNMRVPRDLSPILPYLLWLSDLGLVLFWIHDTSPGQRRSHELADDASDVIVRLVNLAKIPGLRAVRSKVVRWVASMAEQGRW